MLTRATLCLIVAVTTIDPCAADDLLGPLALVQAGGRSKFINTKGERVFGRDFDGAGEFSEGLAPVEHAGKWGYIDDHGTLAIELSLARFKASLRDSLA